MSKQTHHSLQRMSERLGISNQKIATNTILAAKRKGKSPAEFPLDTPFRDFLEIKSAFKKIKVYKGNIYVFNKNSDRCITVYPVPDEYKQDLIDANLTNTLRKDTNN